MCRILCILWASIVVTPAIVFAQPRALGHSVRWDLVLIQHGTALAGGADVAKHAATGDTFTLTGSGDAEPAEREAAGGVVALLATLCRREGRAIRRGELPAESAQNRLGASDRVTARKNWRTMPQDLEIARELATPASPRSPCLPLQF